MSFELSNTTSLYIYYIYIGGLLYSIPQYFCYVYVYLSHIEFKLLCMCETVN